MGGGRRGKWWWPDPWQKRYWPPGVPREETVEAFVQAFATLGYEPCGDLDLALDEAYEKVVLYALGSRPTHMARQLPSGEWMSKLGGYEDITHDVDALRDSDCGDPILVMRRPRSSG